MLNGAPRLFTKKRSKPAMTFGTQGMIIKSMSASTRADMASISTPCQKDIFSPSWLR